MERLFTPSCHLARGLLVLATALVGAAALGCSESHTGSTADAGPAPRDACACVDGPPVGLDGSTTRVDAAAPPDAARPDGGGVTTCAPDDARAIVCPDFECDGPDSFAWDGERCLRIGCGTCEGADCDALPTSETECRARHAACEPEQCRATGGEWLFFAEECEHYRCGLPGPAICESGMPVCNCGAGRSWLEGTGCAADPACGPVDPAPPDVLCAATGGTWAPGICCSTVCGAYCPLACAAPGCVCGALEVFDPLRGCVLGAECLEREAGETCSDSRTRCAPGLLCCERCGGAGCDPERTCAAPLCDADPATDVCGNDSRVP